MEAETAYLFRHALVRDAAYELQTPSRRAALHADTVAILEAHYGQLPPSSETARVPKHPLDPISMDLANHTIAALEGGRTDLQTSAELYLARAGICADREFRRDDSVRLWTKLSEISQSSSRRIHALHRLAHLDMAANRLGQAYERQQAVVSAELEPADQEEALVLHGLRSNARVSMAHIRYQQGDIQEAMHIATELAEDPTLHADVIPAALRVKGMLEMRSGRIDAGAETLLRLVGLCENEPDRGALVDALGSLALIRLEQSRHDEALSLIDRAQALAREVGYTRAEVALEGNKVAILRAAGQDEAAIECARTALGLSRQIGDRAGEAQAEGNLSNGLNALGRKTGVEEGYRRALAIAQEIGSLRSVSLWAGNLGMYLSQNGRPDEARREIEKALALARRLAEPGLIGGWLCGLATHEHRYGQPGAAGPHWREGEALLRAGSPGTLSALTAEMKKVCGELDFDRLYAAPGDSDA